MRQEVHSNLIDDFDGTPTELVNNLKSTSRLGQKNGIYRHASVQGYW